MFSGKNTTINWVKYGNTFKTDMDTSDSDMFPTSDDSSDKKDFKGIFLSAFIYSFAFYIYSS